MRFAKYIPLIFLILSVIFNACSDDKLKPQVTGVTQSKDLPTQESWNSKVLFTEEGNLKAILFSDHIMMYTEKNETLLEGVKIDFYDQQEVHTSTLTSKKGRVDDITKNMYAIDSVVAVNDSGVVLRTERLMWRNKDRKIVTEDFVTIDTPKEKIQGYGFESDQSLDNYVIRDITYFTAAQNPPDTTNRRK